MKIFITNLIILASAFALLTADAANVAKESIEVEEIVDASVEYIDPNPTPLCYPELGCVALNSSWYSLSQRPLNVMPMTRDKIRTNFTLYTRENPIQGSLIYANDTNGITKANFKASRPTKFFIHGFTATGYEQYCVDMRESLLKFGDFNVIIVHWGEGSRVDYVRAIANIRLVGLEIAYLVNTLVNKLGAKTSDFHLIGHSLGAHTAGYAGEAINGLGQITGLDPAGPFFRGMPAFVRLDPTDAVFVDAVHTDSDSGGYGITEPVGHVDFYPNGGENQPGCGSTTVRSAKSTVMEGIADVAGCSHRRAINLYIDSLKQNNSCRFIGFECTNFTSFMKGECSTCGSNNEKCLEFGINVDRSRKNVKAYFNTDSQSPFCRTMYKVSINLAKEDKAKNVIGGEIELSVSGERGQFINVPLTKSSVKLRHGQEESFVITNPVDVGRVKKVNLRWNYRQLSMDAETMCGLMCNKKLYVSSVSLTSLNGIESSKPYKVCPLSKEGFAVIGSGSAFDFSVTTCPA